MSFLLNGVQFSGNVSLPLFDSAGSLFLLIVIELNCSSNDVNSLGGASIKFLSYLYNDSISSPCELFMYLVDDKYLFSVSKSYTLLLNNVGIIFLL